MTMGIIFHPSDSKSGEHTKQAKGKQTQLSYGTRGASFGRTSLKRIFFFFFWLHPWHVEVSRQGMEPTEQL